MKLNIKRIIIFFVFVVFNFSLLLAQSRAVKIAQKKADKAEVREEKASLKSQRKARKHLYEMQSESSKKLIKDTAKHSKKVNKIRKRTKLFNSCSKRKLFKKKLR